jgi:Sortase domain
MNGTPRRAIRFTTASVLVMVLAITTGWMQPTTAVNGGVGQGPAPTVRTYTATNNFWFPALGISRHVYTFACARDQAPDNYVYRWDCAGENNVYLLGHAYGVFKPLHDAYDAGRLKVGMIAIYADSAGHVQKYRITGWRVVNPVDSAWAIASQPVKSMTLQTCVGPNGVDRLNVRLIAIN